MITVHSKMCASHYIPLNFKLDYKKNEEKINGLMTYFEMRRVKIDILDQSRW